MVAELALASSGITRPFPCAILFAYSNCAGLAGLGSRFPADSPSAFLGACSLRNLRQIEIEVLYPAVGLMPFCLARLSAKRFIAGVGGYADAPLPPPTAGPSRWAFPAAAPSLSLPMMRSATSQTASIART